MVLITDANTVVCAFAIGLILVVRTISRHVRPPLRSAAFALFGGTVLLLCVRSPPPPTTSSAPLSSLSLTTTLRDHAPPLALMQPYLRLAEHLLHDDDDDDDEHDAAANEYNDAQLPPRFLGTHGKKAFEASVKNRTFSLLPPLHHDQPSPALPQRLLLDEDFWGRAHVDAAHDDLANMARTLLDEDPRARMRTVCHREWLGLPLAAVWVRLCSAVLATPQNGFYRVLDRCAYDVNLLRSAMTTARVEYMRLSDTLHVQHDTLTAWLTHIRSAVASLGTPSSPIYDLQRLDDRPQHTLEALRLHYVLVLLHMAWRDSLQQHIQNHLMPMMNLCTHRLDLIDTSMQSLLDHSTAPTWNSIDHLLNRSEALWRDIASRFPQDTPRLISRHKLRAGMGRVAARLWCDQDYAAEHALFAQQPSAFSPAGAYPITHEAALASASQFWQQYWLTAPMQGQLWFQNWDQITSRPIEQQQQQQQQQHTMQADPTPEQAPLCPCCPSIYTHLPDGLRHMRSSIEKHLAGYTGKEKRRWTLFDSYTLQGTLAEQRRREDEGEVGWKGVEGEMR